MGVPVLRNPLLVGFQGKQTNTHLEGAICVWVFLDSNRVETLSQEHRAENETRMQFVMISLELPLLSLLAQLKIEVAPSYFGFRLALSVSKVA